VLYEIDGDTIGRAGGREVAPPVTGHTVVYKAIVDTTTFVDAAGQFVTVAGHWVIVKDCVEKTVDVVSWTVLGPTGRDVALAENVPADEVLL